MKFISSSRLAGSPDDSANARLPSTVQRWNGRLPYLFLNWVIAGTALAIRQLPGMATFSPVILSTAIEIAFHNIVATTAWAKQGMASSLRWPAPTGHLPFGPQLPSSQVIAAGTSICGVSAVIATDTQDEDVAYAIACITVFGSVAMFAHPIHADAKAWIVAMTTLLQSIALAAMRLKLTSAD
jgi:uncharacterized membrane protein YadS